MKHLYSRGPIADRFWSRFNKNGPVPAHVPHLGPCWQWLGGASCRGYGRITDTRGEIGPPGYQYRINRAAWILTHGPIADDVVVMHKCDNTGCGNPEHLELGTQADNIADKVAKGREYRRRLTNAERAKVDRMLTEGATRKSIAAEIGVAPNTLARLLRSTTTDDSLRAA